MGVLDGQPVSAAITNPAFINKNVDDTMPNKLGFTRPLSGPSIPDIQAAVNKLYTTTGASESTTGTNYNATPSTIVNGTSHETALTALADKFDPATGHMHTGAPGDGPQIHGSDIIGVVVSIQAGTAGITEQGDITLVAGAGISISGSGTDITISTLAATGGVDSIQAGTGGTPVTGAITLIAGTNISITQSGSQFTIAASAGSGSGEPIATGIYPFVVGTSAQVSAGQAGYTTFAAAQTAASDGDRITYLRGTFTENISVSKVLRIDGLGHGSILNGTVTFTNTSSFSELTDVKITDNVTLNSGANGIFVNNVWLATGKTFIDNGTGNLLEAIVE